MRKILNVFGLAMLVVVPLMSAKADVAPNTSALVLKPVGTRDVADCFFRLKRGPVRQVSYIFKEVNQTVTGDSYTAQLKAYVEYPPGYGPQSPNWGKLPVLAMFHGGGWGAGAPTMWAGPANYFASRGVVTIMFDYRLHHNNLVTPVQGVADAKSAMRWIRKYNAQLGVDPYKLVAMGDSAGGHLALTTQFIDNQTVGKFGKTSDETGADSWLLAQPNAVAVLYPVVNTDNPSAHIAFPQLSPKGVVDAALAAGHPEQLYMPPSIIILGAADTEPLTPPAMTQDFFTRLNAAMAKTKGPCCSVELLPGKNHAFMTQDTDAYQRSMGDFDAFLMRMGYLPMDNQSYPYSWLKNDTLPQCGVADQTATDNLAKAYGY